MAYDWKNLKGDLFGGLVAGIIALPLALAFGVQSGLGAEAGLYGGIAVGIFAALLGGTRTQASGPTGPMTVVSASIVVYAISAAGDLKSGLGIVLLSFLAGGVFQIGLGLLGVGRYVRYFPYPVVSGFMSGVGVIIILLQLWPLLGEKSPKSTLGVVTKFGESDWQINWAAVGLGLFTLVVNYLFPKVTKKVPSVLVALLAGTGAALLLGLDVPTIDDIPSGLPAPQFDALFDVAAEHYLFVLQSGLTLALLGSIDSLLTSVIADNLTRDRHDSRRELIGQGVGNAIAAVFGGIPGAGATKGTVVNINAGAKTRLSGVTHGLFQLAALLGAGALVSYIPLSVLAGLLISVGIAIIDTKGLKHLTDVPKADAAVLLVVFVWTVFGNLIHAVAAGVVLASVLFMKKAADLIEAGSTVSPLDPEPVWEDESAGAQTEAAAGTAAAGLPAAEEGVFVKHLYGPLFFGFSAGFRDLVETLPAEAEVVVIRGERVPYIDQSGLYTLEDAALALTRKGKSVVLTGFRGQPLDMLRRVELIPGLIPEARVFDTFADFRAWLRAGKPEPAEEANASS
ncbi:SulP family inorganic anion transporter [Alienimonas chondri]|uniref:Bicarbonate transporter BicA n=1 Tax=Alienimonas chondri TaxID=2681879 RepID=A0ABX1VA97_9PLAN|nr:SulP family inorganic anion transporter [Alienimonas chondri]NNJ24366.1 Bicarbonate transporter BicA [Alienimonas chondri]